MGNCVIDNSMVPHPRQCRMAMGIGRESISVIIADALREPGSRLLCRNIDLPFDAQGGHSELPAISVVENAVYDNPALLADYDMISVSVDSGLWSVVPKESVAADMDEAVTIASLPEEKTKSTVALRCPVTGTDTVIVSLLPADIVGFLQRTFNNPVITHPLQQLASHFVKTARLTKEPVLHVHFRTCKTMYIIVFAGNSLKLANVFSYHDPMDAVYYILASVAALGMSPSDVQLRLSGEPESRRELVPLVSPYVESAVAATFPASLLREGTQALNAPLELTSLLCE